MSHRLQAMGQQKYKNGFQLTLHEAELNRPYTWKEPKIVFVNSMSDLFHKDVPIEFIQRVFKVMNDTPQHTYQVLTKRADILVELDPLLTWTPNIWMGVSVEDDKALWRVDYLRNTSAHVKFLSYEPLIGSLINLNLQGIDWVIAGGESGSKAGPITKEWVMEIKDKCDAASVPFFFKQWGKKQFNPNPHDPTIAKKYPAHAKGGSMIDGQVYRAMPVRSVEMV